MMKLNDEVTSIAIDAEWADNKFLCVGMAASDAKGKIKNYYVFTDDIASSKYCPSTYKGVSTEIIIYPIGEKGIIEAFDTLPKTLVCYFFYSDRDIEGLLGKDKWRDWLLSGNVSRNRNLNISPYLTENPPCKISFRDLSGRFGCSLDDAYNLVGLNTSDGKDYIKLLNIDKSKMNLFRDNHPEEFYKYSLGDLELHSLGLQLLNLMCDVIKECFGINNVYGNLEEYPKSIGSLVNNLFHRYLDKYHPKILKACCLISTTPNDKAVADLKKYRSWVNNGYNCYKVSKLLETNKYIVPGLGLCSIPAFFSGHYGLNDSSPYCAVVQGGRAIKEVKDEFLFKDVADIDLQSAYGSKLREFDYPFGLPTIYSVGNADEDGGITLKEFLRKYGDELVDGLYTITVSGNLTHKQDLVFSKYGLSSSKIGGKILSQNYATEATESKDSSSLLGGKFILTTKQIELGIITSHVLEILQKVCTTREYKEWMNLEVKAAAYYPKSKEMSLKDWGDTFSQKVNIGVFKAHEDNRSRAWCRIPLEEFIGKILDMRLFYKSKKKEDSIYDCKQLLLKLIINAVYGDLASPFFSMGNTVVANNITGSVRVGSWIMSKALGTKITVTDGGLYTPHSVPKLKTHLKGFRKPGLSTLYLKDNSWNRFVEYIDLLPEKLSEIVQKKDAQELLDSLALEHINKFCCIYNISFPFNIEHKLENSGYLAVINPYGKVDYIIYSYSGKEIIKVRGVRSSHRNKHSKVEFLRKLSQMSHPDYNGCLIDEMIATNDFLRFHWKYGDDLPGYMIPKEYTFKPHYRGGELFDNSDAFYKAEHAHLSRVSKYDKANRDVPLQDKPPFISPRHSVI